LKIRRREVAVLFQGLLNVIQGLLVSFHLGLVSGDLFFLIHVLDWEQQGLVGDGDGVIGGKFGQGMGIAGKCHGILNPGF